MYFNAVDGFDALLSSKPSDFKVLIEIIIAGALTGTEMPWDVSAKKLIDRFILGNKSHLYTYTLLRATYSGLHTALKPLTCVNKSLSPNYEWL